MLHCATGPRRWQRGATDRRHHRTAGPRLDPAGTAPVEVIRRPLDEAALRAALQREAQDVGRRFTLAQIRDIPEVRAGVAPVNVPEVTFDTGSAAIPPDQAQQLATLGKVIPRQHHQQQIARST